MHLFGFRTLNTIIYMIDISWSKKAKFTKMAFLSQFAKLGLFRPFFLVYLYREM